MEIKDTMDIIRVDIIEVQDEYVLTGIAYFSRSESLNILKIEKRKRN